LKSSTAIKLKLQDTSIKIWVQKKVKALSEKKKIPWGNKKKGGKHFKIFPRLIQIEYNNKLSEFVLSDWPQFLRYY
jgi:hypothetical protein